MECGLTAIHLVAHICANFFTSFIGAYLATAVTMLRSRPVAQIKALLLLFPVIDSEFDEARVANFLFGFNEGVSKRLITQTPFFVITTTTQLHPPDCMGSYGAYTPPIESTRGSNESPRPPLSTGATGAAGAINKGIRFHR